MKHPHCPNCRERMSFSEAGFDGVWSCIYCEGVWLTAADIDVLAKAVKVSSSFQPNAEPVGAVVNDSLICPCGSEVSFVPLEAEPSRVFRCKSCQSRFFRRGMLKELAPSVGAGGGAPLVMAKGLAVIAAYLAISALP